MKKIQIPVNITLRYELWPGYGIPDLLKSLLITGIVGVGMVLFYLISTSKYKPITSMLSIILTFAFCAGLFSKMENNQSIYDFYKRRVRYGRQQQLYRYKTEEGGIYHVQRTETGQENEDSSGLSQC